MTRDGSAGDVVGVFAVSHAPGLTGFPERAEARPRAAVAEAYAEVRRRVEALAPDAMVAVSVEHFTNFSLANLPTFAVGTARAYPGPATAQMATFLRVEQREHPGHAELGTHLYEAALAAEFDPALVQGDLSFDENFCVPLELIDPGSRIPLVPIIVNGVNPPGPTLGRCYRLGKLLRSAIEARGSAERVVILATGGLSHWVGTPESGTIDEEFDREFLERLDSGDPERLLDLDQVRIARAGNGADEIRAWVVAAGAAGTGFDTLAYEPVPAWLTGTAVAAARIPAHTS